jgi:hypothetical protein
MAILRFLILLNFLLLANGCTPFGEPEVAPSNFGSQGNEDSDADVTAPEITNPSATGGDATRRKSPLASWVAGSDDVGIEKYQIALGTSSGGTDILNWKDIGNVTSYRVQNGADGVSLTLSYSTDYFLSIRAVDAAGNTSEVKTTSAWQLFEPNDISNLQLWLDARSSENIFSNDVCTTPATGNGDNVRCWKDRSANNISFTQVGASPTLNQTGIGGLQAISVANYRKFDAAWNVAYNPGILYIVANVEDTGSKSTFTGCNNTIIRFEQYNNTGFLGVSRQGWFDKTSTVTTPFNTDSVYIWEKINGTNTIEISTLNGTSNSVDVGAEIPIPGCSSIFGDFQGNVGEIIMFNKTLTASEKLLIENYLKDKWDL